MSHYLVTGGAGFIGSHIVDSLVRTPGHKVSVIDNFLTGSTTNLTTSKDRITLYEGDINDESLLSQILKDVDYIIHQAALPSVPRSIENPIRSNWNNINGTLTLLNAAKEFGVKRVVAASSSSVYGANPVLPKTENLETIPKSPYALTKLTGEHYCRLFYEIYGLETVSLRYFNVFGPRQSPKSQYAAVIPIFIDRLMKNIPVCIHGDGKQTRDFTYIDNVVQANIIACTAPDAPGNAFNIGCQDRISINEIYTFLSELLEKDRLPEYSPERIGDVKHSLADISAARNLLSYNPDVSVQEGLKKTVAYFTSLRDE